MRALVCQNFGSTDDLVVENRDDPAPKKGQVLVDIKAAGINFPDVLTIAGQYQITMPLPFIPGNEGAGTVAEVGPEADGFAPGDQVMFTCMGGAFSEKIVLDASALVPIPTGLNFAQAAGFNVTYGTTFHAFNTCTEIRPGESVLVLGAAGGVGIVAVEIAKAMGAQVIAAASDDDKLAFAKSAGADQTVNYSKQPLKETVKELTGGKGVDVVYDPVGGELALQALRATAWRGRYLVVGFASGEIPSFPANLALLKEAQIIGVHWGQWAGINPRLQAQNLEKMASMIKDGRLNPRVTGQYSLDDYSDAFRTITERRVKGKIVFTM